MVTAKPYTHQRPSTLHPVDPNPLYRVSKDHQESPHLWSSRVSRRVAAVSNVNRKPLDPPLEKSWEGPVGRAVRTPFLWLWIHSSHLFRVRVRPGHEHTERTHETEDLVKSFGHWKSPLCLVGYHTTTPLSRAHAIQSHSPACLP